MNCCLHYRESWSSKSSDAPIAIYINSLLYVILLLEFKLRLTAVRLLQGSRCSFILFIIIRNIINRRDSTGRPLPRSYPHNLNVLLKIGVNDQPKFSKNVSTSKTKFSAIFFSSVPATPSVSPFSLYIDRTIPKTAQVLRKPQLIFVWHWTKPTRTQREIHSA